MIRVSILYLILFHFYQMLVLHSSHFYSLSTISSLSVHRHRRLFQFYLFRRYLIRERYFVINFENTNNKIEPKFALFNTHTLSFSLTLSLLLCGNDVFYKSLALKCINIRFIGCCVNMCVYTKQNNNTESLNAWASHAIIQFVKRFPFFFLL